VADSRAAVEATAAAVVALAAIAAAAVEARVGPRRPATTKTSYRLRGFRCHR
jgi:hypothetical protein